MFITGGLVLLAVWFLGVLGAFDAGTFVHVLLLFGLMLLLIAVLRARAAEAAAAREHSPR